MNDDFFDIPEPQAKDNGFFDIDQADTPGTQFARQQARQLAQNIKPGFVTRYGKPVENSFQSEYNYNFANSPYDMPKPSEVVTRPDPNPKSINKFVNDHVSFGDVRGQFEKQFPGETFPEKAYRSEIEKSYMQNIAQQQAERAKRLYFDPNKMPLAGEPIRVANDKAVSMAKERAKNGNATADDVFNLATADLQNQVNEKKSGWEHLGEAGIALPNMLMDVATLNVPGLIAKGTLEGSLSRSAQQGGAPFDPENLLPAATKAGVEGTIFGKLGGVAKGVESAFGRAATRVGVGMTEQATADIGMGALDEFTPKEYQIGGKYGLPGQLKRREWGGATLNAAQQAMNFAAVAVQHTIGELGVPHDAARKTLETGHDVETARHPQDGDTAPNDNENNQAQGDVQTNQAQANQNPRDQPDVRSQTPVPQPGDTPTDQNGVPVGSGGEPATQVGTPNVQTPEVVQAQTEAVDAKQAPSDIAESTQRGTQAGVDEGATRTRSVDSSAIQTRFKKRYGFGTTDGVAEWKSKFNDYQQLLAGTGLSESELGRLERYAGIAYGLNYDAGSARDVADLTGVSRTTANKRGAGKKDVPLTEEEQARFDEQEAKYRQGGVEQAAEPQLFALPGSNVKLPGGSGKRPSPGQPTQNVPIVTPPDAGDVGAGILRHRNAEKVNRLDRDATALSDGAKYFERYIEGDTNPHSVMTKFLDFFDPIEKGQHQNVPKDQQEFADTYRRVKDQYTDALVSRDIVKDTIDNHVGHLWKDPQDPNATPEAIAARLASRRPLAGRESFKNRRALDLFSDGIAAGLQPVEWNPMKYAMKEFDQYSRSIFGHDARTDMDAEGVRKYVPLGKDVPQGWTSPQDKGDTVFSPPETKVKEYVDKQQMEGLEKFASNIGVKVDTSMTGPPGLYDQQGIVRKFGTPESVLIHEIGHAVDARYGLQSKFSDPKLQKELGDLADLRATGQVSAAYSDYLRDPAEKIANLITGYLHAPELTQKTAPDSYKLLDNILSSDPTLFQLKDIKPSLELDEREQTKRLAGPMLVGKYYYPAEITKLIDNHISSGFGKYRAFQAFRGASSQMSQFILGSSAFHATGTALNAQFSAIGEALVAGSRGDFGRAMRKLPEAIMPFWAAAKATKLGSAVRGEWDVPGSGTLEVQQLAELMRMGGGRARGGAEYFGSQFDQFSKNLRQVSAGDYGKVPEALVRAIPAINQLISKPTMEYLVPLTKLGVASDAMRYEMSRMQGASPSEVKTAMGKIWDQVDDRFGLLTYDNLFYPRAVRDSLQASFLSFGWNLGDVRGLVGGAKDLLSPSQMVKTLQGEGVTRKTAFLVSMMAGTAMYGAGYQFLRTGKGPDELKDYFFPKTGEKNKDGTAERISLPTYMRDIASVFNRAGDGPMAIPKNLYSMTKSKLTPLLHILSEVLDNQDWRGAAVYDPSDSALTQAKDVAMHFLSNVMPISARQIGDKGGIGKTTQSFFGLTPAPSRITHTDEQQRKAERDRKVESTPLQKKQFSRP